MLKHGHYIAINLGLAAGLLFNHYVHPAQYIDEIHSGRHQRIALYVSALKNGLAASHSEATRIHTEEAHLPAAEFQDRG